MTSWWCLWPIQHHTVHFSFPPLLIYNFFLRQWETWLSLPIVYLLICSTPIYMHSNFKIATLYPCVKQLYLPEYRNFSPQFSIETLFCKVTQVSCTFFPTTFSEVISCNFNIVTLICLSLHSILDFFNILVDFFKHLYPLKFPLCNVWSNSFWQMHGVYPSSQHHTKQFSHLTAPPWVFLWFIPPTPSVFGNYWPNFCLCHFVWLGFFTATLFY